MSTRHARLFALCFVLLVLAAGLMLQQPIQTFANPDRTVDLFDTAQTVTQNGLGSTWQRVVGGADIIGAEREVTLTVLNVGSSSVASIDTNGGGLGRMAQSQGTNVVAYSIFTYDGNDNSQNINYSGLGNVDLTANGDNAFVAIIHSNNFSTARDQITVTVYSNATSCSYRVLQLPSPPVISGDPAVAMVFRYVNTNQFSQCSGFASAANFTSVNVIQIQLTGGQEDNDIALELFETTRLDYGDLPSGPVVYNAMTVGSLTSGGHVIGSIRLGSQIDGEDNGQQNASDAKRDNTTLTPNDEDGVALSAGQTQWNAGGTNSVNVVVSGGNGCLVAWMDFSGTGFTDPGDYIVQNVPVVPGNNTISFNVPGGTSPTGVFYSRWRLFERNDGVGPDNGTCTYPSFNTTSAFSGRYGNGEVEDHRLGFNDPTAVTLSDLTAQTDSNRWLQFSALGVLLAGVVVVVLRRN
ncbi:MAG: hypothetical protein HY868_24270 [Chloroflexi bacterium]|nr:hypothetical protein [Chloroflexota bacterium]